MTERVRFRVVAALVLGARTTDDVIEAAGLPRVEVQRALDRLVARGVVEVSAPPRAYRVREEALRRIAGEGAKPRPKAVHDPALPEAQRKALEAFMPTGRLASMPASRTKRRAILDYISIRFDPGRTYPEREVNAMLADVHDDYAMLRRALIDEEFLERRDGFYWRAGGTFEVD